MRTIKAFLLLVGISLILALPGESARATPNVAVSLAVSNPYCVQSSVKTGVCTINIRSLTASTSDSSFNYVTISIAGKMRLRIQSFFESAAYFSYDMLGDGLEVSCGGPNASGNPAYGLIYPVSIVGYSTNSSPITDIANVTCPFYEGKIYIPAVKK